MKPSLTTALLIAGLTVGLTVGLTADPARAAESKAGADITSASTYITPASAYIPPAAEPEMSTDLAHLAEPEAGASADITRATEPKAGADVTSVRTDVTPVSAYIPLATEPEANATTNAAELIPTPTPAPRISAGIVHAAPAPAHISLNAIPVCYDFGCKSRATVSLSRGEWAGVAGWFSPPAETPVAERIQIKKAVGWMETVIGRHTPTHKDLALNLPPDTTGLFPGQLDCIDEATNTTAYLRLFEINNFLKHHTVVEPAYRRSLFNQHWSGQVQENKSGTRYVVDSWFQPNGYSPSVQESEKWKNLKMLSALMYNGDDGIEKPSLWRRLRSRP